MFISEDLLRLKFTPESYAVLKVCLLWGRDHGNYSQERRFIECVEKANTDDRLFALDENDRINLSIILEDYMTVDPKGNELFEKFHQISKNHMDHDYAQPRQETPINI